MSRLRNPGYQRIVIDSAFLFAMVAVVCLFVALSFYARPATDDYYFFNSLQDHGLWGALSLYYRTVGGRLPAVGLSLTGYGVFGLENGYALVAVTVLVALFAAYSFLISAFYPSDSGRRSALFGALCLLVLFLQMMPGTSEGLYYLSNGVGGTVCYSLALIGVAMLAGASRAETRRTRIIGVAVALLLLMFGAGTHENFALILLGVVLLGAAYHLVVRDRAGLLWVVATAVIVAVLALNAFSPGTAVRMESATTAAESRSVLGSLANALKHAGRHFVEFSMNPALLSFTVLFVTARSRTWAEMSGDSVRGRGLFLLSIPAWFALLVLSLWPWYWVSSFPPQARVVNITCLVFLLGWFMSISVLGASHARRSSQDAATVGLRVLWAGALILFIIHLLLDENVRAASFRLLQRAVNALSLGHWVSLLPLVVVGVVCASFYGLMWVFLRNEFSRAVRFSGSLLLFALLMQAVPNSGHVGAWLSTELACQSLAILGIALLVGDQDGRSSQRRIAGLAVSLFLLMMGAVTNERFAVIVLCVVLMGIIHSSWIRAGNVFPWVSATCVVVATIVVSRLDPAAVVRSQSLGSAGYTTTFIGSLVMATTYTARQMGASAMNPGLLCATVMFVVTLAGRPDPSEDQSIRERNFLICLIPIWFVLMLMVYWVPYALPHRSSRLSSANVPSLVFLLGWFASVAILQSAWNWRDRRSDHTAQTLSFLATAAKLVFVVSLLFVGNARIAAYELISGDAARFARARDERIRLAREAVARGESHLDVAIIRTKPKTLYSGWPHLSYNVDDYRNRNVAKYVGLKTVAKKVDHPNEYIRKAIEYAQSRGLSVMTHSNWGTQKRSTHVWGVIWFSSESGPVCRIRVDVKPRSPELHAEEIRRAVDNCPHSSKR